MINHSSGLREGNKQYVLKSNLELPLKLLTRNVCVETGKPMGSGCWSRGKYALIEGIKITPRTKQNRKSQKLSMR